MILKSKPVKTPTIFQMEAAECGAAALAIILGYYHLYLPLERVRADCGVSRDGSRAVNILKAARGYGMEADGLKKEPEELETLQMPVILHWNFSHFVVLEGIYREKVFINDPAQGRRTISMDELNRSFSGTVLTFTPGPGFSPGGKEDSVLDALIPRTRTEIWPLFFVILAGFVMLIPGIVFPTATRLFIDYILIGSHYQWLSGLLAFMVLFLIIQGIVTILREICLAQWQVHLSYRLSTTFFYKILFLPISFFDQRYAGEIASRVALNDQIAYVLTERAASAILDLLIAVVYLVILFWYNSTLTLIAAGIAIINLVFLQMVSEWRKNTSRRLIADKGKLAGVAVSGIQAIESLKASGREGDFFEKWAGYHANYLNSQRSMAYSSLLLSLIPAFLLSLSTTLILAVGSDMILKGSMTIGFFFAYQALLSNFLMPLQRLVGLGGEIQDLAGDMQRIHDVEKNLPAKGPGSDPETNLPAPSVMPSKKLEGYLDIKDVTFGYCPIDAPLIKNLNIRVKPGQQVALVGPSGCGKSTIARLAIGLNTPWSGEVQMDHLTPDKITPAVRVLSIAYVSQDVFLFEGTVRENITLWDTTVPEQDIIQAAKDAEIHDLVTSLPGGYDYHLFEGGKNLSGGQRQRLEIARALACAPSILVLDEATSALDPITEKRIELNLRRRGCSCLIIAHRLSTIRDCDWIYTLNKGEIVEEGRHQQLIQQAGPYHDLIRAEDMEVRKDFGSSHA